MGLSRYFRRKHWDRERRYELESYIRIETDENIARGMPESAAREAARRKLGNATLVREEIYAMNTVTLLESFARDIRYGWRLLRRNPVFTAAALMTLALGVGANTAVFSVVNAVLIKPLPYPEPDRLVAVWHSAPGAAGLASVSGDLRLSLSMYATYAEHNHSFDSIGVWYQSTSTVTGIAEPEEVRQVTVSGGALQTLNVPPVLGRWLSSADEKPGAPPAVMLSYGYWQRRFGGDAGVTNRTINVDSRLRQVAGVMPQGFRFVDNDFDLIQPLVVDRSKLILPGFGFQCVARLKRGVTLAQAGTDIARLIPIWMDSWPAAPGIDPHVYDAWRIGPALRSLQADVVGNVSNGLWVLFAAIGIVMLVACANVANLMLVRAEGRRRELVIRAALGAGATRIVREMLIESTLLGLMGGALGVAFGYAGLRILVAFGPANLPRLSEVSIDGAVLSFAFGIAFLSGLLFGAIPALKYARGRISETLRNGGRGHSPERHRAQGALVVVQVAMALVLLISSGLMIRTFVALRRVDPGFTAPAQIQLVRTSIPQALVREPERVLRMQNDILDRLTAIPGIRSASFETRVPMEGTPPDWDVIVTEGQTLRSSEIPPLRLFKSVTPGLFRTMGTRMVAGRDYTWTDLYEQRRVAIISENLAQELFGSAAVALGKRISTGLPKSPWREVIGVVSDVRDNGVHEPAPAIVYWPSYRESLYNSRSDVERTGTFVIAATRAGSQALLHEVSQAVWSVNPSLPLASMRTMEEVYDRSMARTSFTLLMLGTASGMALVLGLVGIYGVIAYAVSQRRREVGIRLALGAEQRELKIMFVRYALILAGTGTGIGLAVAAGLTRTMRALLFGIGPLDPLTYVTVPIVLTAVAALAAYLPARRTARVDPAESLRAD
jgi:predicted permease